MKAKRRTVKGLGVILAVVGVLLLVGAGASALWDRLFESMYASPQRLVYHTDHAAVLRACRQVLANPEAAGFLKEDNGYNMIEGLQSGGRPPAALPAILRNLNFEFMIIDPGGIRIVFGGGFGHWGYNTAPPAEYPRLELIPGLWYWSEGGGLPRDLSRFPYYRTSKRLLGGGVAAIGLGIWLMSYARRSAADS